MTEAREPSLQSSTASGDSEGGGYDCELVCQSQSAFQTQCPLCRRLLRDPCLVSCCARKYCRVCVRKVRRDEKACLECGEGDFTFTSDHGLGRFLDELEVWCSHKKEGCEWTGKLGKLTEHLNHTPSSPESQLTGCALVDVECSHGCGGRMLRRCIEEHEAEKCKERPYSCDYCQDYHSTFEDVTEVHHLECGQYPVSCPNKCQESMFDRRDLETHSEQCPLAVIDCPFHYAGCETKLPRKDMPEHITKEALPHLTWLGSVTQNLLKENVELRERAVARESEVRELRRRLMAREEESCRNVAVIRRLVRDGEQKRQELVYTQQSTDSNVEWLKQEVHKLRVELTQSSGYPIDYQIPLGKGAIFLSPFFTHPHGYKICLRVYPNGYGRASGTHISIFMYLMKGPFDAHLKWPFRGELTVQIVNQAGDHTHWEDTSDKRLGGIYAARVTERERAEGGWGFQHFLPLTALQYDTAKKIQYLKDGHFIVRVISMKCMV